MRSRIAFILISITLGATPALADDPHAARQHFDDGSKLYDLGKFRDAAREYEEAYKYKPDPVLLFNIGQAYRAAGDSGEAITAYKSYLRRVPEARNRAEVEAHISKLQKLIEEQRATQPSPAPTGAIPPTGATLGTPVPPVGSNALTAAPASPEEKMPVYKKWWLWTAVGGALVVGGAVALAVAYTTPKDAASPPNTFGVSLH